MPTRFPRPYHYAVAVVLVAAGLLTFIVTNSSDMNLVHARNDASAADGPFSSIRPIGRMVASCGPKDCRPSVGPRKSIQCPAGSVRLRPSRSLKSAIDGHSKGTTFCFRRGTYRLRRSLLPKAGDVFIGEYGAVLLGSKVVTNWSRVGGYWVATGQTQEGEVVAGVPCKINIACNRPEAVFIDGRMLLQVTSLAAVRRGRFYFDYATNTIYMADDPRQHKVEASVADGAFRSTTQYAPGVVIRNLVIERFANPSRIGAIHTSVSPGWVVRDNEITDNHGVGVDIMDGAKILNNEISHNGQLGVGGYQARNVLVQDNEIARNASGGYAGWEAGGAKFVESTNLTFRGNYVHHNRHHGLWTDTGNIGTVFARNTVIGNAGVGIFHEKSGRCRIRGNYIAHNREDGVFLSSSSHVEVDENAFVKNRGGDVELFKDGADSHDLSDNLVHDNVFLVRAGAQTGLTTANVADATEYSYSKGNHFRSNHYFVPELAGKRWVWDSRSLGWRGWRAAGQDLKGTLRKS